MGDISNNNPLIGSIWLTARRPNTNAKIATQYNSMPPIALIECMFLKSLVK